MTSRAVRLISPRKHQFQEQEEQEFSRCMPDACAPMHVSLRSSIYQRISALPWKSFYCCRNQPPQISSTLSLNPRMQLIRGRSSKRVSRARENTTREGKARQGKARQGKGRPYPGVAFPDAVNLWAFDHDLDDLRARFLGTMQHSTGRSFFTERAPHASKGKRTGTVSGSGYYRTWTVLEAGFTAVRERISRNRELNRRKRCSTRLADRFHTTGTVCIRG